MAESKTGKPKVLVVDDEEFMGNLIVGVLNQLGYDDVLVANSGDAALALFDGSHQAPDIVLSDLNMPGLDGIGLLQKLAERKFSGGIVLISGLDTRVIDTVGKVVARLELNILGSLAKPVAAAVLARLIGKFTPESTR